MHDSIRPELQAGLWDQWPNADGQDVRQAIATTHATWMLDASLFEAPATAEERANALRAARMMGYTLFRAATRMTHAPDGSAQLTVRIENRGAAPFYYVWPAELEALDVSGKVVARARADWPLPSLLPGRKAEMERGAACRTGDDPDGAAGDRESNAGRASGGVRECGDGNCTEWVADAAVNSMGCRSNPNPWRRRQKTITD
ncbi:MAG TPA: hypothetical protein VMD92_00460 [Acidobacteriaceae bacterium]|nr:hypothetical protein [Acidobacteriaceae bacterium]